MEIYFIQSILTKARPKGIYRKGHTGLNIFPRKDEKEIRD